MPGSSLAIVLGAFASFGGFLYGYDTGYISGVKEMPAFLQTFGQLENGVYVLSTERDSLFTSILSAGTFFGALAAYPIGDRLGRRFGIIAFLGLFCIGVACQTGSNTVAGFTIGRVFAGLGVGGTSCLVPMYQAECAPKHIRGLIVSAYQWCITIGLLISACIVYGTKDMGTKAAYRIPIGLQFIWAAILASGLVVLPESPRWLVMKERHEDARQSLSRLWAAPPDSPEVSEHFDHILSNLRHEQSLGRSSYADCFRGGEGKNRRRVLSGCALQALQQLTGINFIFYYGTTFFKRSGITNPFLITIATNVVNVGMTVPGMALVDRLGRRSLLLYGAAGMAVSQLIVAIVGETVSADNMAGQRVLIAFVCIFIAHFAATWGPLAWVVTSEMYPLALRGKAMSLSTASNWLLNFAIGYSTPYLVDPGEGRANLQSKVFFIWGGCCVICFIFVFFFIPETKGLSLEQVDLLYRNSTVVNSNRFRKEILAQNAHDDANADQKMATATAHIENEKSSRHTDSPI